MAGFGLKARTNLDCDRVSFGWKQPFGEKCDVSVNLEL